jgi:hypothetical protein
VQLVVLAQTTQLYASVCFKMKPVGISLAFIATNLSQAAQLMPKADDNDTNIYTKDKL